jgi:transposase-like protein
MGEQRRTFPAEFKQNALELVRTSGRSVAAIAMELGIERGLIDRWRREMKEGETSSRKAFVGQGNARDEELAQLRRENADLRETNEILKKAVGIFTQKGPR